MRSVFRQNIPDQGVGCGVWGDGEMGCGVWGVGCGEMGRWGIMTDN
ncbi:MULTISPECIES: hypothetical protein [unclassified Microcystis]|nr:MULTISPECIES: hypothetical protein [unclassified Microcystis]MCA2507050.1 hypothetical protein [Microcystis sp. M62BS1]MCA2521180.1 hypothetical protein [Microcystis sp. M63BS1]MCA2551264.1 hypothetical protein [Microcystis sp. M53BS1]MCA2567707.1 hypothetical protein [Microcystis sp. M44BS1]MCA2611048.1 hypothetical protein [Microcystis sp. M27BS1]MCA2639189.1 hypothetical protein [Microcystis sp. M18BS1]